MVIDEKLIVVVTGTRRRTKALTRAVSKRLKSHNKPGRPWMVYQGECPHGGADFVAKKWCEIKAILCVGFTPCSAKDRSGLKIRNSVMVDTAGAMMALGYKVVIEAFPDDQSRGTWDVVNKAELKRLEVVVTKV